MDFSLKQEFLEELRAFVFFHLGSDADVRIEDVSDGIGVSVKHRRVHGFHFTVKEDRLRDLLEDSSRLEEFLLDYLVTYRRS